MGNRFFLSLGVLVQLSVVMPSVGVKPHADPALVDKISNVNVNGVLLRGLGDAITDDETCAGLVQAEFEEPTLSPEVVAGIHAQTWVSLPTKFGYQARVEDEIEKFVRAELERLGLSGNAREMLVRILLSFAEGYSNALKGNGADVVRKLYHRSKLVYSRIRLDGTRFTIDIIDESGKPFHPDICHSGNDRRAKSGDESLNIEALQAKHAGASRCEGGRGIWLLQHYPYEVHWYEATRRGVRGTHLQMVWDLADVRELPKMPLKYAAPGLASEESGGEPDPAAMAAMLGMSLEDYLAFQQMIGE